MFKKFAGGGNPLLRNSLQNESASTLSVAQEGTMTTQGAINKTLILFGILLITAIYNYLSLIHIYTPIIVFINKLDREGKDAVDLLDEVEKKLGLHVTPLSWPIGMGQQFKGVYNICLLYTSRCV